MAQASEFARGGEFRRSIDTLMLLSTPEVDAGTVEAAMLRAADICNQFLQGRDAIEIAIQLGPRSYFFIIFSFIFF